MMNNARPRMLRTLISSILICSLLLTLCPAVYAETFGTIPVYCENDKFFLQVMNRNSEWYVKADDLAKIGNLQVSVNDTKEILTIYKETPFAVLYTADKKTHIEREDGQYIPLQEASKAAGIRFFEMDGDINFEVLRTPKELMAELSSKVFGNRRFHLDDLIMSFGAEWIGFETAARAYATLSPFSLSEVAKAATGEAEQERYNEAMADINSNDEAEVSSFAALADINKSFTKTDKVLDTFDWFFEKSSKFTYWLNGSNWTQAEFQTLRDQMEFYGELGGTREFLNAYSEVSKALDFKYILDVIL